MIILKSNTKYSFLEFMEIGALKQNHPEKCLTEGQSFCSQESPCCSGLKCKGFFPILRPTTCVSDTKGDFKRKCKNTRLTFFAFYVFKH